MEEFRSALDQESRSAADAANVERGKFAILSDNLPAACDAQLQRVLEQSAASLGLTSRAMASGAGHDMAFLAQVAPAAMVFIPCKEGRSHTPEEWASADAVADGTRVLLDAILKVDAAPAAKVLAPRGAVS